MRALTAVFCLALVVAAAAMPQGGRPVAPTRSRLTGMLDNMMDDVGSIANRIRTGFTRTVGTVGSSVNGRPRPAVRAGPSAPLDPARQLTDGAPNAPPFRRPQQGGAAGGMGGSIRRAFNRVADGMRSVMQNIRRNAPNRPQ